MQRLGELVAADLCTNYDAGKNSPHPLTPHSLKLAHAKSCSNREILDNLGSNNRKFPKIGQFGFTVQ